MGSVSLPESFGFEMALQLIKNGYHVTRKNWNGKGMFVSLQNPDENSKMTRPYLYLTIPVAQTHQFDGTQTTPEGIEMIPWLVSQTDLMAIDWTVVTA